MKGTRALSFLLALALLISLAVPGFFAVPAKAEDADNGLHISKTAEYNADDGTYTITLEAYATGEKVISSVNTDVPADIILVLDQSTSMKNNRMGTVSFKLYKDDEGWFGSTHTQNEDYYEVRHNGGSANLWHKLDGDSYVSVSVTKQEGASHTEISQNSRSYEYYRYRNVLYEKVGDSYQEVKLTVNGNNYTFTFSDKSTVSSKSNDVPQLGSHAPLYYKTVDDTKTVYTYTYTNASGETVLIGTSIGATTVFVPTLYERVVTTDNNSPTRLEALRTAVSSFADAVAEKAKGPDGKYGTDDDVQHRIAVVGFACSNTGDDDDYNNYQNTELFIGSTQYKYGTAAQGQYSRAFQDMRTEGGRDNITASIGALTADGATYVNHGIEIANGIFNANPVEKGKSRSRIVIVFTDGVPGYSGYESGVASSAITEANTSRDAYGANVYAVGVFNGANAGSAGSNADNATETQKANWFMQNLSDNKGTPHSPSYYLSADNSATLSTIFKQIAEKIEDSSSSTTLKSDAVIRDIIAPQFRLPEGAGVESITLETYQYTGVGDDPWSKNETALGASATIEGDQVSVTGFDFSENWCGTVTEDGKTTYRGNKLVISFKVEVKDGFLGGNGVYTNTSAGVFENADAENPVFVFDRPQVDVPIGTVSVTPTDKNVYLLGGVTADTLKSGTTVTVGGVPLNLSQANNNYGLADWQTAYVDINVVVTDKDGNVISTDGFTGLTEDNSYTVSVTVSPTTTGTATTQSGNGTGNIYVYKPVLTYKDSDVYYGDAVPADFSSNLAFTVWKHGTTEATSAMGNPPALALTYAPDSSKIDNGKINTKQDVPVDVGVKIGTVDVTNYVDFVHQGCTDTETLPDGKEFLLHVKTCQLTITKTGGASGEPYVFTVYKGGEKYTEASITGNGSVIIYELPVGTYTIREDTGWSWRYTPGYSDGGNGVTLSSKIPNGSITCTNRQTKNFWLNGFSTVVQNIFGVKH